MALVEIKISFSQVFDIFIWIIAIWKFLDIEI